MGGGSRPAGGGYYRGGVWLLALVAVVADLGGHLQPAWACSFDYSIVHCKDAGKLDITCTDNYAIRILSSRKRKLRQGACADEDSLHDSCYSESSAYSTVATACNTQKSCSVDVSRILSYGNTGCNDYSGDYVLHLIFRCEPPALPEDVAWTKSICSPQADPLPWAYIHSLIPNTVSPFIGSTDCACQIGVPANVEVQIQPRKFSLTKYGTWCGQKLVLRDGAESREFCSQLYDPFIMPCWNTYRYLDLSFQNDDTSILTHFNISIWATTGEQLDFKCGLRPTTTTETTTVIPTSTSTTPSTTTTSPHIIPSKSTSSSTPTRTSTRTQSTATTTSSTTTSTTPTTTNTTTTQPTTATTTQTTTTTEPPSIRSTSTSTLSSTHRQSSSTSSSSLSSSTTSRDPNAVGPKEDVPSSGNSQGPLEDERDYNAIIIGGATGGLVLLVIIVTATAIGCARRRKSGGSAAASNVSSGSSRRGRHTYESTVHKVPPPPMAVNPYATPRYGPYGPVDPGGGGGNEENVYCEIPADHVPEPSPHMLQSKRPYGSAYPGDSLSTEHIYEEPTYYTMPYDPEPPSLPRHHHHIDPARGTMTVGSRPPPMYPPPPISSVNGGVAQQNPLFLQDPHRESMLFAY